MDLTECDGTYPDQCRTPRLDRFFDKPDSGDFPDAFFVSNQIDTLIFTCLQEPASTSARRHDRPRVDNSFDAVNHRG